MTRRRLALLLLCGSLIVALTLGIRQSFGVFLRPVIDDLQLSRETFALAIALQNLLWGLAQPLAGMLADRWGVRRVLSGGAALFAAGLWLAAGSRTPLDLHVSLGLLVGLGLAGGSYAVVLSAVGRTVPAAFRSTALGVVSAGASIGMFSLVPGAQALVSSLGWSQGFLILATALAIVPLCALALGRPAVAEQGGAAASMGSALREAGSHRGYWLLNAGFLVCGFHVAFIMTHLPAYLSDRALSPRSAAWSLATIGLFNIVGTLVWGVLGGRFRKKYVLSMLYLARAVVIAVFLMVPLSQASALAFAAMMGFLWLGTVPLTNGLVADVFGVRYLGTLFGIVFLSHQVGSFFGAWLGGHLYEATGSYDAVWVIAILLGLASALLHWPIDDRPLARRLAT